MQSNHLFDILSSITILPILKAGCQSLIFFWYKKDNRSSIFLDLIDFFFLAIAGFLAILFYNQSSLQELVYLQSVTNLLGQETSLHLSVSPTMLLLWLAKELLVFLADRFSKKYLFNDPGLPKLLLGFSFLSFSINLVLFSNSFISFALGWELLGLTSVLLIAFYHRRPASIERSFVTFIFYKFGDFCLLSAFLFLANQRFVHSFEEITPISLHENQEVYSILLVLFLIAAIIKSGLLPFSFWFPRSLEGPTPSSALFYGALSSHSGIFLILRILETGMPVSGKMRAAIVTLGGISALFGHLMTITRSDVKSKNLYATLTQISLIFMEIGFGWTKIAVIHCIIHMFYRFFRFLIAPSEIYLARRFELWEEPSKLDFSSEKNESLYHWIWWLALHEFGLPTFWRRIGLSPLVSAGTMFAHSRRYLLFPLEKLQSTRRSEFFNFRGIKKDILRYFVFLSTMMIWFFLKLRGYENSTMGIIICQVLAIIFSLLAIQEKRLSSTFFYLIFSGGLLVNSYYFSVGPETPENMVNHFFVTLLGFSLVSGLFILFRGLFILPDDRDYHGLDIVTPRLSMFFGLLLLVIVGFPGLSTYFSFDVMSEGLTKSSFTFVLSGLFILTVNTYLWFNLYGRLFWGEKQR